MERMWEACSIRSPADCAGTALPLPRMAGHQDRGAASPESVMKADELRDK